MKKVTFEVSDPTAEKLERMSDAERKSISKTLDILVERKRTVEEIMDDLSNQAERKGLTPEILEQILKEIDAERR